MIIESDNLLNFLHLRISLQEDFLKECIGKNNSTLGEEFQKAYSNGRIDCLRELIWLIKKYHYDFSNYKDEEINKGSL